MGREGVVKNAQGGGSMTYMRNVRIYARFPLAIFIARSTLAGLEIEIKYGSHVCHIENLQFIYYLLQ